MDSKEEKIEVPERRGLLFYLMRLFHFLKRVVTNVTIEPGLFLIALGFNVEDIVLTQMLIYKSCRIDFGYNVTVCDNLVSDYKDQNDLVQDEVKLSVWRSSCYLI